MLFLVHWKVKPEARNETLERFKKAGHNPPAGIKILNAATKVDQKEGWAFAEANDAVAIGKWLYHWSDLNEQEVVPVLSDEDLLAVLKP